MRRGETGFALMEAMIGAAIVAVTLVAMYGALVESATRNRMVEQRRMAMLIAQSELATVGVTIPPTPGVTEGTEGNFYWRVDIAPYADGPPPSIAGQLCQVTVSVEDSHRAPLTSLTSLVLAPAGT